MKRIKKIIMLTAAIIPFFFFLIQPVSAEPLLNKTAGLETMTNTTGTEAGMAHVSVGLLVAKIIQVILGFLAIIFLVLMITAGFRWMTAGGNEEQTKKAIATIKNATIGLVVVLLAYAITYFLFKSLPFSGGGTIPTN